MRLPLPEKLPSLPRWAIATVAILLIAGLAAGQHLYQALLIEPGNAALESASQQRAETYAAAVTAFIDEATARAGARARRPGALSQPEATDDDGGGLGADARLYRVPADGENPFSVSSNFVALELTREVLAGDSPAPQAAKLDGTWWLYVARPVPEGGQVAGVLLLELPLNQLREHLAGIGQPSGQVQVIQAVPGNIPAVLVTLGSAPEDAQPFIAPTRVPGWSVNFRPGPALTGAIPATIWPFALAATLLAVFDLLLCALVIRFAIKPRKTAPREAPRINDETQMPTPDFNRPSPGNGTPEEKAGQSYTLPAGVFRDYDIRGRAGSQINTYFAEQLGKVLGTRALEHGEHTLAVAADGRHSSPDLSRSLTRGILSTGCDVIYLGRVPTPTLNYALETLQTTTSGVMVTASHNPATDNGFKIISRGHVLSNREIQEIRQAMEEKRFATGEPGESQDKDLVDDYLGAIVENVLPATGIRVVVDGGHGIAGEFAPRLLRELGCDVVELYCDVDGDFPNHDPDPTVTENLRDLITVVEHEKADLGIAFDGDGDRLVAVSASGRIAWPDELLMIFARDVVARSPGADVIYDVKSTRRLHGLISSYGGRPVMGKTGHAHMRNRMAETGAPVGGEYSGHLFFNDRWYGFDDALYAAARLLEIMTIREQGLDDILAALPASVSTPEIRVPVGDERKFELVERLVEAGDFEDGNTNTLDGLRVEYADGWGLVRASNTGPALTLRFEADTEKALERIKTVFREQLARVDDSLDLDF